MAKRGHWNKYIFSKYNWEKRSMRCDRCGSTESTMWFRNLDSKENRLIRHKDLCWDCAQEKNMNGDFILLSCDKVRSRIAFPIKEADISGYKWATDVTTPEEKQKNLEISLAEKAGINVEGPKLEQDSIWVWVDSADIEHTEVYKDFDMLLEDIKSGELKGGFICTKFYEICNRPYLSPIIKT